MCDIAFNFPSCVSQNNTPLFKKKTIYSLYDINKNFTIYIRRIQHFYCLFTYDINTFNFSFAKYKIAVLVRAHK